MGDFVERYGFRIVSGESPETMQKLCLSKKFSHQEIRWNYGILRKVFYHMKDHEALFAFWQKISFWDSPVFMLSTLKATTIKIYFLHYEIGIKRYVLHHTWHFTRTFPQSYTYIRSLVFMKLTTFSMSKTGKS